MSDTHPDTLEERSIDPAVTPLRIITSLEFSEVESRIGLARFVAAGELDSPYRRLLRQLANDAEFGLRIARQIHEQRQRDLHRREREMRRRPND
jgi:hypothetical protein